MTASEDILAYARGQNTSGKGTLRRNRKYLCAEDARPRAFCVFGEKAFAWQMRRLKRKTRTGHIRCGSPFCAADGACFAFFISAGA